MCLGGGFRSGVRLCPSDEPEPVTTRERQLGHHKISLNGRGGNGNPPHRRPPEDWCSRVAVARV